MSYISGGCKLADSYSSCLSQLLHFSPDAILDRANITKKDLRDLLKTFEPLQADLEGMLNGLNNVSAIFDLDGLTNAATAKQKGISSHPAL